MRQLDHISENASPVSVSQSGLIRLSGPARAIALNVLRVNSLQTGAYVSRFRGRGAGGEYRCVRRDGRPL